MSEVELRHALYTPRKKRPMKLSVKHMVCNRCVMVVEQILNETGNLKVRRVDLGSIELEDDLSNQALTELRSELKQKGFDLLDDDKSQKVELIKTAIIQEIHHQSGRKGSNENFSSFLTRELQLDYSYLNDLFSSIEGKTIGQYITLQKIEKAKELLVYDQMSLAEIADLLEYNSGQYLSAQFKKVTGLPPSKFRDLGQRRTIDRV